MLFEQNHDLYLNNSQRILVTVVSKLAYFFI